MPLISQHLIQCLAHRYSLIFVEWTSVEALFTLPWTPHTNFQCGYRESSAEGDIIIAWQSGNFSPDLLTMTSVPVELLLLPFTSGQGLFCQQQWTKTFRRLSVSSLPLCLYSVIVISGHSHFRTKPRARELKNQQLGLEGRLGKCLQSKASKLIYCCWGEKR